VAGFLYARLYHEAGIDYAREVRKVFQKLSDNEKIHARQIDLGLQANEN